MKRPVVDYREFRFSRINEPRFSHLKLLAGWIGYLILYFLTENLIPPERCHVVHCFLDDLIPFCEYFLIPYCLWFALIVGTLLYFLLYDPDMFRHVSWFIIITQAVAMIVYIVWPSRQDLRPDAFVRDNFFTHLMAFIYRFDTSTGVCPSLHVAYSLGLMSGWLKYRRSPLWCKILIVFLAILISVSTMFVKQHSAVDVLAALPLGALAEFLAFYGWRKAQRSRRLLPENAGETPGDPGPGKAAGKERRAAKDGVPGNGGNQVRPIRNGQGY